MPLTKEIPSLNKSVSRTLLVVQQYLVFLVWLFIELILNSCLTDTKMAAVGKLVVYIGISTYLVELH